MVAAADVGPPAATESAEVSMIERAGDAAYTAWIHSGRHEGDTWEQVARAVIAALREPTAAMLKAGVRGFQKAYSSDDTLADWRACYKSMIDKALES